MNEMDQILMREHHLENETLSLKAKGLFSKLMMVHTKTFSQGGHENAVRRNGKERD